MTASLIVSYKRKRKYQRALEERNQQLVEEKRKQEALYEQLEIATRDKLLFFTRISHDLLTPLTLITEPVERLSKSAGLEPAEKKLADVARKNAGVLKRLITQLLDFRKYESGKLSLHTRQTDISRALIEWGTNFRSLASEREIDFKIDISAVRGLSIAIDPDKIERIIFNLLSNAFKHTKPRGSVTLSAKTADGKLEIFVADSGDGIAADELAHIFKDYYKSKENSKPGSGIGLAFGKALAELHGGGISVKSELGHGATFVLTIPMSHATLSEASEKPSEGKEEKNVSGGERDIDDPLSSELNVETAQSPIEPSDNRHTNPHHSDKPLLLIIEDNQDMQALIKLSMEDDYRVLTAADGSEGVKLALEQVPDVIISDVMMPVMDGIEACAVIKDNVATSHIPVLLLTACIQDEQRIEGYKSGADSYLSKPFNAGLLQVRVKNLLDNRRKISDYLSWQTGNVDPGEEEPSIVPDVEDEFYGKFLSLVHDNISKTSLGIDELASHMGLGQSQFGRKIKALTGHTPVALIRIIRLNEGRRLILSTSRTISEIAYEVGFTSPAYFTKCFQTEFGVSPSALRENSKQ